MPIKQAVKRIDFRVPPDVLRDLRAMAEAHGRSLNGELLWAVREAAARARVKGEIPK